MRSFTLSFPRKRESRAAGVRPSLDARFRGHDTCVSTQTPHFEQLRALVAHFIALGRAFQIPGHVGLASVGSLPVGISRIGFGMRDAPAMRKTDMWSDLLPSPPIRRRAKGEENGDQSQRIPSHCNALLHLPWLSRPGRPAKRPASGLADGGIIASSHGFCRVRFIPGGQAPPLAHILAMSAAFASVSTFQHKSMAPRITGAGSIPSARSANFTS